MDIKLSFSKSKRRENRKTLSASSHNAILKACQKDSNQKDDLYFKKQKREICFFSRKKVKSFFNNLFLIGEITRMEKDIMFSLISFWGENGIFPNYKSIAIETRCSLPSAKRCTKRMKTLGYLDWENRRIRKQQFSNKYFFTISEEEFARVTQKSDEIKKDAEKAKKGKSPEKKHFLTMFFQRIKKRLTRDNYNKYNYFMKVSQNSGNLRPFSVENSVDRFPKPRLTLCDLASRKYQALLKKSHDQAQAFLRAILPLNMHADTEAYVSETELEKVRSALARLDVYRL